MRAFAALALGCAVGACAAGSSYMGIPLDAPVAAGPDAALRSLAARAQAGDKHAQLELGIAFEEGRGVPRDWDKAERLYRLAASDSGGTTWVYLPPVGNGTRGRVMPVDQGAAQPALPDAAERLRRLQRASDDNDREDRR